jgi:hypothetical protein
MDVGSRCWNVGAPTAPCCSVENDEYSSISFFCESSPFCTAHAATAVEIFLLNLKSWVTISLRYLFAFPEVKRAMGIFRQLRRLHFPPASDFTFTGAGLYCQRGSGSGRTNFCRSILKTIRPENA